MGFGNWIQLAALAGSLYQSNKAQDGAEDYAKRTAAEAADMLAFTKAQYADSLPYVKAAQAKSLEVADAQLGSMRQQDALAKEYADYNRTTFRPLEQGIVAGAAGYDTPEKRQAAADSALADVNMQFASTNAGRARQLAASGVNPESARSQAVMGSQGIDQARAGAGAAGQARRGVETTGFARQMDAASLGRNLPSAQATSAGLGIQAGTSAVNTSVAGANAGVPTGSLAQSGMFNAGNLNLAAGALNQRATDSQNQLWGQLGQVGGRYYTSDVNMKTDIEEANPEQALAQVTATPVSTFKFNPAAMASAGIPMERPAGEQQTGPMAQDVHATMGEDAAPDGKKLNVGTMIGKAMLSIQALDKRVSQIASMLGGGQLQAGASA